MKREPVHVLASVERRDKSRNTYDLYRIELVTTNWQEAMYQMERHAEMRDVDITQWLEWNPIEGFRRVHTFDRCVSPAFSDYLSLNCLSPFTCFLEKHSAQVMQAWIHQTRAIDWPFTADADDDDSDLTDAVAALDSEVSKAEESQR